MNFLKLICNKIKNRYTLTDLFFLELEALFFGFFSIIPSSIGIILRFLLFRLFSSRCEGFCWIQCNVAIIHSNRIKFGHSVAISPFTYINGVGEIEIGNFVLIGPNVTISSGAHPIKSRMIPIITQQTNLKKIIIEDDVWIGAGAVIMPGVRLSKGTVVGANAVVLKSTNPYEVVAGIPSKTLYVR